MAEKVDQMDPDEKIVEIAIERLRVLALELRNYMKLAHPGVSISKPGYLKQRMKLNPICAWGFVFFRLAEPYSFSVSVVVGILISEPSAANIK